MFNFGTNWHYSDQNSGYAIERCTCREFCDVHYFQGEKIKRHERAKYMQQLVSAAKQVRAYRRKLQHFPVWTG